MSRLIMRSSECESCSEKQQAQYNLYESVWLLSSLSSAAAYKVWLLCDWRIQLQESFISKICQFSNAFICAAMLAWLTLLFFFQTWVSVLLTEFDTHSLWAWVCCVRFAACFEFICKIWQLALSFLTAYASEFILSILLLN